MADAKRADVTPATTSKTTKRRFEAQDETPPDSGGGTKSSGTLPAMGDAGE